MRIMRSRVPALPASLWLVPPKLQTAFLPLHFHFVLGAAWHSHAPLGATDGAHLLQSFWLLSEHRACAATLSVNEISPGELEAGGGNAGKWDIQC